MRSRSKKHRSPTLVTMAGLVVALALLSYALVLASPASLATAAWASLASAGVSVSASVPANPDNTLAQQLDEKAAQLNVQQQHIEQLQQSVGGSDQLGLYSLIASICLFLLVAANFYFDWRRSRSRPGALVRALSVDLRRGS